MTVVNDEQMRQALEQIDRLYHALAALKADVFPVSPKNYALLAEGPFDQIRALQAEVDTYLEAEETAQIWLHISGREIEWRRAPTSVLTAMLDTLRKGVQAVAEFLATGQLATRPTASLKRACDFRVVALAPGSLRIGVRLPEHPRMEPASASETEEQAVDRALEAYLGAAAWAGSSLGPESLEQELADIQLRRLVLTELARLVPRERGDVDVVELSGKALPKGPARLARDTRQRVNDAIDRTVIEQVETFEGVLREIDLDRCSFIVRFAPPAPQDIRCDFDPSLLETAKEALDRKVRVTGTRRVESGRRTSIPLWVTRLEVVDELDREG